VGQGTGLSEAVIRFLERGVSVSVASSDRAKRLRLGRALGCRASADGAWLSVYLDRAASGALLAAIAETGRVAVVITEPSTHRSVQVKGEDARVGALEPEEAGIPAHHTDAFVVELAGIGFTEDFTRALMAHDPADVVAVRLRPAAVFDQTPGPNAGARVPP